MRRHLIRSSGSAPGFGFDLMWNMHIKRRDVKRTVLRKTRGSVRSPLWCVYMWCTVVCLFFTYGVCVGVRESDLRRVLPINGKPLKHRVMYQSQRVGGETAEIQRVRRRNVDRRCNNDSPWLEPDEQESSPEYSVHPEREEWCFAGCCLPDYQDRGDCSFCKEMCVCAHTCNALVTRWRLFQGLGGELLLPWILASLKIGWCVLSQYSACCILRWNSVHDIYIHIWWDRCGTSF